MKIKICGITNLEDAQVAVDTGADYLGFILYPKSPRSITLQAAAEIIEALRAAGNAPHMVGVFVNESSATITEKMSRGHFDFAQLSGDESPQVLTTLYGKAYKAIRPSSIQFAELDVKDYAPLGILDAHHPAILVDAHHPNLYGGTGELADLEIVRQITTLEPRTMLAGGLNPDNVGEIVQAVQPFAIDVASGVEATPGKKDHDRVYSFVKNARAAAGQ